MTPAGSKVMEQAAKNIKKVSLELGGKSPNIVFADADLDHAVKGVIFGIFLQAPGKPSLYFLLPVPLPLIQLE